MILETYSAQISDQLASNRSTWFHQSCSSDATLAVEVPRVVAAINHSPYLRHGIRVEPPLPRQDPSHGLAVRREVADHSQWQLSPQGGEPVGHRCRTPDAPNCALRATGR